MNLNKKEEEIIREILKIKVSTDITVKMIIERLRDNQIKYENNKDKYIFLDASSIEYLKVITCTLKKLINHNLLYLSKSSVENKKNSIVFVNNNDEELNHFLILELKDIFSNFIYITDDLRNLFEPSFLKRFLIILYLLISIIFFVCVYFFLEQLLIRYIYILGIFLTMVPLTLCIYKNKKKLITFWNYPSLNINTLNTILTVWGFIITTLSLVISIISLIISIQPLH